MTTKKKIIISVLAVLLAIILAAGGYLLYVVLSYYRVPDNQKLDIIGAAEDKVPTAKELSLVTYNIGFGAYGPDYSFFMDGGKHSRALSENDVQQNTLGALRTVLEQNADFICFQEVDIDGDRSYHIDQTEILSGGLPDYDSIFAQNYDSPYFFYPISEPIGANKSGIMTFSKYNITEATRRSLPIEESFYKYLDLDRAYTVSVAEVEGGKQLVIYNVHLSAYTSDGTIANDQLEMLAKDMKAEYDKGNYVIAAGDFNKDLLGDSSQYFIREEGDGDYTWAQSIDPSLIPGEFICYSGTNAPTCRNADAPFKGDGTDFVLSVDGFLISDNITVTSCQTIDTDFSYSDHDPVKAVFTLN